MDYEKKYKQALEKAKKELNTCGSQDCDAARQIFRLFPELKESEDERIRKEIINYFTEGREFLSLCSFDREHILAWLKKQGKQPKKVSIWKHWKDGIAGGSEDEQIFLIKIGRIYSISSCLGCECDYIELSELDKLMREEKQDKSALEAIKCVKPADKVEPKFREGDWVFIEEIEGYKQGAFQIKSVDEFGYNFDGCRTIPFMYKDLLSKWTIQDAKDGDVLCSGQIILLFKNWEYDSDWNFVIAYAGIDVSSKLQITNEHWLISNESKPATKEQRDLLFSKMKEAGYEWDAEKKELRIIDWSKHIKYEPNGPSIIEKSSWSEEDEKRLQSCLNVLQPRGIMGVTETINTKWLKSLKERIQPKQEWSEDDGNRINRLIAYFEDKESFTAEDDVVYANWLKSLKDRYTWKPSDEQMEALESAAENCAYSEYQDCLRELIGQLKELKEE